VGSSGTGLRGVLSVWVSKHSVDTRVARMATVVAWVAAIAVAGALAYVRFKGAMASEIRFDFQTSYLPAARAVAAGKSPYAVAGYVYSPLVALILAPFVNVWWVTAAWTALLVAVALASCTIAVLASTERTPSVLRAGLFAMAAITLMSNGAMTTELWLGQADVFVMLSIAVTMLATSRGIRGIGGLSLAMAAVVKSWPGALLLWLLRAPRRERPWEWLGSGSAAVFSIALALFVGGPSALSNMVTAPFKASHQPLAAYSALGAGKILFTDSGISTPISTSPTLDYATTAFLVLFVCGLLATVLYRPGNSVIALLNLAFCVILLLPVSHYAYLLFPLPALWWWSARALEDWRRVRSWAVPGTLFVWWFSAMQLTPAGDTARNISWQSFVLIFGSTLVAATVSVIGAARLGRVSEKRAREAVEPSEPDARLTLVGPAAGHLGLIRPPPTIRDERRSVR